MAEFEECMQQFDDMKARIKNIHADCDENNYLRDMPNKQNVSTPKLYLKEMRHLRGHFGEVYAMQRAGDSRSLASPSQDGKLFVWDGFTTNKTVVVPLRSSWVITCDFAPSQMLTKDNNSMHLAMRCNKHIKIYSDQKKK
eukprot:341332_1